MPFSGTSEGPLGACPRAQRSGTQLIAFTDSALSLQGVLPSPLEPRRALLQDNVFWSVGDEAVASFDVSDRLRPLALGRATLARYVSQVLPLANGHVARINQSWYEDTSSIDFVAQAALDDPNATLGELDLARALPTGAGCLSSRVISQAFVSGNQLRLSYESFDTGQSGMMVVDASNPAEPRALSDLAWNLSPSSSGWVRANASYQYNYGYSPAHAHAVQTEHAFAQLERASDDNHWRLRVVDLGDPEHVTGTTLDLPDAAGYGGVLADGQGVLVTYYQKGLSDGRGSFFLRRVDLSNARQPDLGAEVNLPGALLHYDAGQARVVTSDLVRTVAAGLSPDACTARFAYYDVGNQNEGGLLSPGTCEGYVQVLRLARLEGESAVLEDSLTLDERERVSSSSLADGKIMATLTRDHASLGPTFALDCFNPALFGSSFDCTASEPFTSMPADLLVLRDWGSGSLGVERVTSAASALPWAGFYASPSLAAFGTKAVAAGRADAAIFDTSLTGASKLVRIAVLFGDPIEIVGGAGSALLALGKNGSQRVDL